MKKIALLALVPILLSSMTTAMANEYVGVKEGDWFEYSWTYWGNATEGEDKSVWTKITVEEINGTEITFKGEHRFEDGQEEADTVVQDVITGKNSGLLFVRTDLDVGDLIYTEGELMGKEGLRINETILRTYLGTPIEVVHLNYSETKPLGFTFVGPNGTMEEPEGPLYTLNPNWYWERRTGVLQEWFYTFNSTEDNAEGGFKILITDKNFEPSDSEPTDGEFEFPVMTVLLIGLPVSAVVIIVCGWRLSKRHA